MYSKFHGGRMRSILILAIILCVAITSMSCLPSKPAGTTVSAKDTEQDAAISEVKRAVQNLDTTKANDSSLKSLRDDVDARFRNVSGADAYTKGQTYTQAEVNQKIADAITVLKNDQSWITKTTTGGGGSSSGDTSYDEGAVVSTSGNLVLSLDRPAEDEYYLGNGGEATFRLAVTNNDTTSHTFRITANFDSDETIAMEAANTSLHADYSYSSGVVMVRNVTLPASVQNLNFTSRRSSGSTDTTWYIGKSRTEDIYMVFKVDYTDDSLYRTWDWDFTIKEID